MPAARRGRAPRGGSPDDLAHDTAHDRLWVTLTARNELVGFDMRDDTPRKIVR